MGYKEYKCMKPLTLKQLYLPPNMPDIATIQQGGIWLLISRNKAKNIVTLEKKSTQPAQIRCNITFACFAEYFELYREGDHNEQ